MVTRQLCSNAKQMQITSATGVTHYSMNLAHTDSDYEPYYQDRMQMYPNGF